MLYVLMTYSALIYMLCTYKLIDKVAYSLQNSKDLEECFNSMRFFAPYVDMGL